MTFHSTTASSPPSSFTGGGWSDTRSDTGADAEDYGLVIEPDIVVNDDPDNATTPKGGTKRQMGGAAIAAGVVGTVVLGPVVGVLAAAGAAGGAALGKGRAGDMARSGGEVVASAGDRVQHWNQKHQVTAKASQGFVKSANWMSNKLKVGNKQDGGGPDR